MIYKIPAGIRRILIGGSAGSMEQVGRLLRDLRPDSTPPIVLLVHIEGGYQQTRLCEVVAQMLPFPCEVAQHGTQLEPGKLYTPHAHYHLLIEPDTNTCRLFDDEPFSYARPSIDLLFGSCVGQGAARTAAILLSGANEDGARGMQELHASGAFCAVADPALSLFPTMPAAALKRTPALHVLNPVRLGT